MPKLDAYAFPGGYPIFYLDDTNNVLCANCASQEEKIPIGGINWESLCYCDECGEEIGSAYGEI